VEYKHSQHNYTTPRTTPTTIAPILLKAELNIAFSDDASSVGSAGDGSSFRPADSCAASAEGGTCGGSVGSGVAGGGGDDDKEDEDADGEDEDSLSLYSSTTSSLAHAGELGPLSPRGHKYKRMTTARARAHEVKITTRGHLSARPSPDLLL
jgi:hypothetical protein